MRMSLPKKRKGLLRTTALILATSFAATGCSSLSAIDNREPVSQGLSYQAEYRTPKDRGRHWDRSASSQNRSQCSDNGAASLAHAPMNTAFTPDTVLLSAGDLVMVMVGSDATFTGTHEIAQDGRLALPHLAPIIALGRTTDSIERELGQALVSQGYYDQPPRISVRLQDFAPARVFVSGSVFEPGAVTIGGVSGADRDSIRQEALGATAEARRLSRALQSAGGIRPDADLSSVRIRRGQKTIVVDARPAMLGRPYNDLILLAGDHVDVGSRDCFQEELVKPTPVTTPGVKVFMSNLTQPAASNANSAIGKEARELRYGTRFLEAIVGMNCMGGTKLVNANRTAALISRNPVTGESIVIERRVEELLRSADRDDFNPYMMPGDALACYDSGVTNVFDVARGMSSVAAAAALLTL
ncbi:polysaccharide biosynthesis/export family protein [Oricola sp.]|uniref:polysaccharide biosynthesis/export family protein n=1 Tax=Oricola sp. TaxID=1979950 RepID=UPI0025F536BD|nr:polysaccharide biosynthesis/export family protein [Oricola sp.]MCI5078610.1 polysaccharide biosynthesis/export family protein [Oricola sp.]